MPSFSQRSIDRLQTCDWRLAAVCVEVIKHFDFTVLEGHRNEAAQNAAFEAGTSKLRWPDGKHNAYPSLAIDVAPYPIDWEDRERFVYLAGFIMATAARMGFRFRWGGDWDRDKRLEGDERFRDYGHFEIDEPHPPDTVIA